MGQSKRPTRRQLGIVMAAATSGLAAPALAGPHGWLTESVFLSLGERLPDWARLKVFRID